MVEAKKRLRMMLKEYRNQFSEAQWTRIEEKLQFYTLDLLQKLNAQSVGCYLKSLRNREVSTDALMKSLLESGIKVSVPVVGDEFTMKMIPITSETDFTTNTWGIPEPVDSSSVHELIPDFLVIPMLGADRNGYRIGYGKGYYDRYLSKHQVVKIGVCPQACVIRELPVDEFDIPMDFLITENGIIRRNAK